MTAMVMMTMKPTSLMVQMTDMMITMMMARAIMTKILRMTTMIMMTVI